MATSTTRPRPPVPYRAAAVVIGVALLLGAAFALSYTVALGRPAPHDVPVAVVLPTGSTVAALHEAVHSRGHQHLTPFVVLATWFVVIGPVLVAGSRWRGRSPAQ